MQHMQLHQFLLVQRKKLRQSDIAEAAARAAEEVKQEEARQAAVLAELESLREQFLSEIA